MKPLFIFRSRKKEQEHLESVDGERSIPSVNKTMRFQGKLTSWGILAFAAGLTGFMLYSYYSPYFHKKKEEKEQQTDEVVLQHKGSLRPLQTPTLPPEFTTPAPQEQASAPPANNAPPLPAQSAQQQTGPDGKPVLTPEQIIMQRRENAPVAFSSRGGGQGSTGNSNDMSGTDGGSWDNRVVTPDAATQAQTGGSLMSGSEEQQGDPLTQRLQPSTFAQSKASYMGDTSLLLAQGTPIKCSQFQAIDSTLPGQVSCIGAEDVWNADKTVILMEKGTVYHGLIRQGLSNGQKRLFVMWNDARTPKKVRVPLMSGGGDSLGRSGLDGYVDTHFWERFGAALLISVIDDLGDYVANSGSNNSSGNTNINFGNTAQAAGDVTSEVIRQTANIPPTLTRNQGSRVMIYVARDVDFSDVYSLEPNR